MGLLPSASLGMRRKQIGGASAIFGLYEPIHGSAPDIAGKGIANPLGSIQSLSLLFRLTLDRPDDAKLLEAAVAAALAKGARTADLAEAGKRPVSTREMGDMVLEQLALRVAKAAA
ncbi:MAG TPA: isocitrate/isopropylmalate family dehydrogenase, partial [Reyranella sp.]|nr:isocitrate/isopropylmalate family dehydrogenase [Reyranella sp.]